MTEGTYSDQVLRDYHDGIIDGITGAPTTFINGELYAVTGIELIEVVKGHAGRATNS